MNNDRIHGVAFGIIGFIVAASFLFSIGVSITNAFKVNEIDAVVLDKNVVMSSTDKNGIEYRYLIFTDKGTFTNEMSIIYGKFETSDSYFRLQKGHKYHMKVVGYGKSLITDYPNIVKFKEIE